MENFNLKLKSATEALHKTVESTEASHAIISPHVSLEVYRDYLKRTYAIHYAVESTVFPVVKNTIRDVNSRIKTGSIINDLTLMGNKPAVSDLTLLDDGYSPDVNFNLGVMYVAEGSVLGGQYILRNIKKALGEDVPCNFLNVYGEKTGQVWKDFLQQLNGYAETVSQSEQEKIIAGAIYGFKRVYAVFNHKNIQ